jgi:bifunctional ADP-heptose synthase (sugar kinase/adenylyltransferase)
MATLSLALAAGATFEAAARLANYAGGLVVMKRGTATVSPDELRNAVRADGDGEAQGSQRRPGNGGESRGRTNLRRGAKRHG